MRRKEGAEQITIDSDEIFVHYDFLNTGNKTTDYSLRIRRSTGRYVETLEVKGSEPLELSGTCLVFR
jgi:hypothetical protein